MIILSTLPDQRPARYVGRHRWRVVRSRRLHELTEQHHGHGNDFALLEELLSYPDRVSGRATVR